MTTATVAADPAAKIKRNAEIAYKSLHSWVTAGVSVIAFVAMYWLGPDWIVAFVKEHYGVLLSAPVLSQILIWLAQLAPQNITLAVDKQKVWRDFVLGTAAKLMPGQPLALPPEIAKAAGLPDIVHAPISPAPVDVSLPMPGAAVMGDLRKVVAPDPVAALPPAAVLDIRSQLAAENPAWTPAQLDSAVVAYQRSSRP